MTSFVWTAPHEVEGHFQFAANGLSPYWALGALLFDGHDGDLQDLEVLIGGETWTVDFYDQDGGGIAPSGPAADTNAEAMNEYRIAMRGDGERKLHYHVRPRWDGMRSTSGGDLPTPFDRESWPDEGIDVSWNASNVEPGQILTALPIALRRIAETGEKYLNPHYFEHLYAGSIRTYERYVRVAREAAKKVVGTTGVMRRLFHYAAEEVGSSVTYEANNDEIVGHRHRVVLDEGAIREVLPGHEAGKQIKHYHPKHPQEDETDPLYHPKIGVLFKSAWNGSDGAWDWDERHELHRELDEALLNVLSWSKLPIRPDSTTFIEDDHYVVRERSDSDPSVALYDDRTPELESKQDALLVRGLRDLTNGDLDVLESALAMTDGGEPAHPEELATHADRGISTVYRVLDRLDDWLENDHAAVRFRSRYLKEQLGGVLERIEETVESGAQLVGEVLDLDPQRMKEDGSAFQRWLTRYAGEVLDADRPNVDTVIKVRKTLTRKRHLAKRQGHDYLGDVIEYLDQVIARADLDRSLGQIALEFETPYGRDSITSESNTWWSLYGEDLVYPDSPPP